MRLEEPLIDWTLLSLGVFWTCFCLTSLFKSALVTLPSLVLIAPLASRSSSVTLWPAFRAKNKAVCFFSSTVFTSPYKDILERNVKANKSIWYDFPYKTEPLADFPEISLTVLASIWARYLYIILLRSVHHLLNRSILRRHPLIMFEFDFEIWTNKVQSLKNIDVRLMEYFVTGIHRK